MWDSAPLLTSRQVLSTAAAEQTAGYKLSRTDEALELKGAEAAAAAAVAAAAAATEVSSATAVAAAAAARQRKQQRQWQQQ